jgi:hypothetical protein
MTTANQKATMRRLIRFCGKAIGFFAANPDAVMECKDMIFFKSLDVMDYVRLRVWAFMGYEEAVPLSMQSMATMPSN